MKYRCDNCEKTFDELSVRHTTYESYYGVASLFPNSTRLELDVCPFCGYEDITEEEDDEDVERC